MSTSALSKYWLKKNTPQFLNCKTRVSKYYPDQELWFFTFPTSFFDELNQGDLIVLLQDRKSAEDFHLLKVPFQFFRENRTHFDIRADGSQFDLHISAKPAKWLVDIRSKGVDFNSFLLAKNTK